MPEEIDNTSHGLLNLPLCEPALVKRQSDIQHESILCNELSCLEIYPLSADVQNGAAIVCIHNRNTKSHACTKLLWSVLVANLQIRRGIGDTSPIADALDEGAALCSRTNL